MQFSVTIAPETILVAFWILSCHSNVDHTLAFGGPLACTSLPEAEAKVGKVLM